MIKKANNKTPKVTILLNACLSSIATKDPSYPRISQISHIPTKFNRIESSQIHQLCTNYNWVAQFD